MIDKLKSLQPKNTTDWLIFAAMAGLTFVNPGAVAKVILKMIKEESANSKNKKLTSTQVSRAIYEFKKREIIEFKEEAGKTVIVLTEKGKKRGLKFDLDNIKIRKMISWDRKWRMLLFDIPEEMKSAREIFRDKLKKMGFLQFQKSVWIYPYPCEDEIDFLAEYFRIASHVNLLTLIIEDDIPLRSHFDL